MDSTNKNTNWGIAAWFEKIIKQLYVSRGLKVERERAEGLLTMLTAENYSKNESERAERWLLRGDWKFKGKQPILELADFYPSSEQLEPQQQIAIRQVPATGDTGLSKVQQLKNFMNKEMRNPSGTVVTRKFYAHQIREFIDYEVIAEHNVSAAGCDSGGYPLYFIVGVPF